MNKDYNKRPNIYDVVKIPSVKKHIIKFVEEHNCKAEVMNIYDIDDKANKITESSTEKNKFEETQTNQILTYQLEQLEEWAEFIRNDIKIADYKSGWFGQH